MAECEIIKYILRLDAQTDRGATVFVDLPAADTTLMIQLC